MMIAIFNNPKSVTAIYQKRDIIDNLLEKIKYAIPNISYRTLSSEDKESALEKVTKLQERLRTGYSITNIDENIENIESVIKKDEKIEPELRKQLFDLKQRRWDINKNRPNPEIPLEQG